MNSILDPSGEGLCCSIDRRLDNPRVASSLSLANSPKQSYRLPRSQVRQDGPDRSSESERSPNTQEQLPRLLLFQVVGRPIRVNAFRVPDPSRVSKHLQVKPMALILRVHLCLASYKPFPVVRQVISLAMNRLCQSLGPRE